MANVDLTKHKVPTQAPKWLGTYGKYLWPKVAAYLNKDDKIIRADEYLLQQYCSTYDIYRNAYQELLKHGLQQAIYKTVVSPTTGEVVAKQFSGFKKNPAVNIIRDSVNQLNSIGKSLGMSPAARDKLLQLKTPKKKKKSTTEALKEFLK